jgi:hypothetical protein
MALGTVTLDLGASPTQEGSVDVPSSGLLSNSHIEAWVQRDSTVDNDAAAHEMLQTFAEFTTEFLTSTTFRIYVRIVGVLAQKTFTLHWGHN